MKYGGFGKDSLEKGEEGNMKKNGAREKRGDRMICYSITVFRSDPGFIQHPLTRPLAQQMPHGLITLLKGPTITLPTLTTHRPSGRDIIPPLEILLVHRLKHQESGDEGLVILPTYS